MFWKKTYDWDLHKCRPGSFLALSSIQLNNRKKSNGKAEEQLEAVECALFNLGKLFSNGISDFLGWYPLTTEICKHNKKHSIFHGL